MCYCPNPSDCADIKYLIFLISVDTGWFLRAHFDTAATVVS